MSDLMELTELEFNDNDFSNQNKTTNFGGGLELLMNDKIKEGNRGTSDINLEDLNNLENELNSLVDDLPLNKVKEFSSKLVKYLGQSKPEYGQIVAATAKLDQKLEDIIKAAVIASSSRNSIELCWSAS